MLNLSDTAYRVTYKTYFLLLLGLSALVLLHGCAGAAATPGGVAAIATGTVAAADAGINSLVANKVIDPASASGLLGWIHLVANNVTQLATLPDQVHAMQTQHLIDLAAVKAQAASDVVTLTAKIPTQAELFMHDGAAATGGIAGTNLYRGPVTPAVMKTPDAIATITKAA